MGSAKIIFKIAKILLKLVKVLYKLGLLDPENLSLLTGQIEGLGGDE
ncbi:MAG: hypothetical protein IIZ66_02640 [Clostridia bacterium]|nr:hypothetical protein [Clostridia bacterium]